MEENDEFAVSAEEGRSRVFTQLKSYCFELLELVQSPKKSSSSISSLLQFLRQTPSHALQPFFDYTLFPLLLLLDASVDCRSPKKLGSEEKVVSANITKVPQKVSDSVAEGVLQCLEELLAKCLLGSVDQMVVVLKKLTYGALLSPSDASEEFREGVIKCFRALLLNLFPCSDKSCTCNQIFGLPMLLEKRDFISPPIRSPKYASASDECLLSFLQSQAASAAVGHWLSLLLKAADNEAARGHLGSAKIRVEAFLTLRVLVAKVGTADALAFFLPGVVSQFAKVLHASKMMTSGAAGSGDAIDQAIRGLAEYLMIVLLDDANLSGRDMSITVTSDKEYESTQSFMDELRQLPTKAHAQSKILLDDSSGQMITATSKSERKTNSGKGDASFHVNRTDDWIEKTSVHVDKLLGTTFRHICIHPAKKVRQGLLASIRGLLSKCTYTLRQSRQMFLECLCVLVIDDSEEVSAGAQEFLENLFSLVGKYQLEQDVAQIFSRLIDKLPKVVLGSEESVALSHAQQLLVIMYYSGPQFVVDHILQSPVTATRFLDIFAICMSQNSVFAGSLDKLITSRPSSVIYLDSVSELKAGINLTSDCLINMAATPQNPKITAIQEKDTPYTSDNTQKNYELPHMPPWFVYIGGRKLYQSLSGILRLVGLSLMADKKNGQHLALVTDIPLGYLRKLVSEVRMKDYNETSWHSWYKRTGSGQLLRQASTAVCILNEMIFGISDQATEYFRRRFQNSRKRSQEFPESDAEFVGGQPFKTELSMFGESRWKVLQDEGLRSYLIDCIGRILHEYLSHEVWDLPTENRSSIILHDYEAEDISINLFHDTAMLQQVIIEGIGIISICLGGDFASSGFLHQSLYLLLENLISSNYHVRSASDAVLHILAATSGYPTVGHLVLGNADYVIDSICRQLRHLEINPHVPSVLAAMLSYIGVAYKILPLFEEPMRSVSLELEILGRHQHPELTIPFLKAVAEIAKASKREACSLPTHAESYMLDVKAKISDMEKKDEDDINMSHVESEKWESILFKLNDSKRYRRTVGAIASSCIMAATPLLASENQAACLVALDIVDDGVTSLAKVEEAYRHERDTKEAIEEVIQSYSLYHLQDNLDAADEGADENRLLPAMNKIWPFLVVCIRNKNPVAVRICLSVVSNAVQICGGDFFSRRFHTDGSHFWKLLSTSPFHRKPNFKEERIPLQLPCRSTSSSSESSMAETSNLKVQVAVLNMIAELSRNKRSASALDIVLKKISGLVVGIACSGVVGLREASVNALQGLASVDPDLIWLLMADVYYSMKKKDIPSPPTPDIPAISQILPPPSCPKEYLYVQYGGQSYGFDVDFASVETVFNKLHSLVFVNQMYS
ncbi:uncharacterized protein LOC133728620 [Rosa rugosa]|uniref:uncharacterized protein LOC133728620 n=1 Tax=Rosa rugosa TaxID=74645 RepID=UPI002B40A9BC|nr:uncharacterized protein LOC133728620 [Rosa rugosa]